MNTQQSVNSKELIQSYILTVAKYEANIYVKRILTHIVSANQDYLKGRKLDGIINIERDIFENREYTINAKELLINESDKNYRRIYDAFDYLQNKFLRYEDDEIYFRVPFISEVYGKKKDGTIKFRMSKLMYKAFTNYTKGHSRYELAISLSLSSVYSIRLYEFLANQTKPQTRTIESLKEMFQVQDKYKLTKDFIRRVIEPAKKELDEKSPVSFEYSMNKTGRKITSITFHPYKTNNQDISLEQKKLNKQMSLSWDFDKNIIAYLKSAFGFTPLELKIQRELFLDAKNNIDDFIGFLSKKRAPANRVSNPKGYLINAIKGELANIQDQKESNFNTSRVAQSLSDKFNINN